MNNEKNIQAILFDLDGTLLPLEQAVFSKQYLTALITYATKLGMPKEVFVVGVERMLKNDGSYKNSQVFWAVYEEITSKKQCDIEDSLAEFYNTDFKELKRFTYPNHLARKIVDVARRNGRKVVVATNPVLPMVAHLERLSWIGLNKDDFELITAYENSAFCKPNPKYYIEICEKIGVNPENCIMLGNDDSDDMKGASSAGIECFLINDFRITSTDYIWSGANGSFEDAIQMLETL